MGDHGYVNFPNSMDNSIYTVNITCDYDYVPPAIEYIENLGTFGTVFVSLGTIIMTVTLYLSVNASYAIIITKKTKSLKRNILIILCVYPIASLCSLVALAIPRAQLLSEGVIQIVLTIALYRLYLLLIDVGLRDEVKKTPPLKLKVGPCCCWPCLPFPQLEMNSDNLSWLQIIVLQLPIVQTLVYCVFFFMAVDNPMIFTRYGVFLQPLSITSILLGLYGLSITVMTLQEISPDSNLRHKAAVVQMVLLFSKLQGFIIKSLAGTGLFPCNPPITPRVYANVTYNALMLIEMLCLCYAARLVYTEDENFNNNNDDGQSNNFPSNDNDNTVNYSNDNDNNQTRNNHSKNSTGIRIELDRHNQISNNRELSTITGQNLPMNSRLASVIA